MKYRLVFPELGSGKSKVLAAKSDEHVSLVNILLNNASIISI